MKSKKNHELILSQIVYCSVNSLFSGLQTFKQSFLKSITQTDLGAIYR